MINDLTRQQLYDSVKTLVESNSPKLLLNQHKLYSLFSISFQYMLYQSTKEPGAYIIRIENSSLAEKLAKKSKDPSTRKFIQNMLLPRKLRFQRSTFYVDFFHFGTWNLTNTIPADKIKGCIIIKNTSKSTIGQLQELEEEAQELINQEHYLKTLSEVSPKTILIQHQEEDKDGFETVNFPFIKKEVPKDIPGLKLGSDIDWDAIDQ